MELVLRALPVADTSPIPATRNVTSDTSSALRESNFSS